jgi:hypothetical protein
MRFIFDRTLKVASSGQTITNEKYAGTELNKNPF